MSAVFQQRREADLREAAFTPAAHRSPECVAIRHLVGYVQRAAVNAYYAPFPVPGPASRRFRDWLHHFLVQLPDRLPAKPCARLRDACIARNPDLYRWVR